MMKLFYFYINYFIYNFNTFNFIENLLYEKKKEKELYRDDKTR